MKKRGIGIFAFVCMGTAQAADLEAQRAFRSLKRAADSQPFQVIARHFNEARAMAYLELPLVTHAASLNRWKCSKVSDITTETG